MQEEIKCPQCGGNKFNERGNNTYKCMYCGSVFSTRKPNTLKSADYSESASESSKVTVNVNVGANPQQPNYQEHFQYVSRKSRITTAVLALFLGGFGAHHFYLGKNGLGVLYIIFCWTWIPGIIAVIEGLLYLCMSDQEFNRKYNQ